VKSSATTSALWLCELNKIREHTHLSGQAMKFEPRSRDPLTRGQRSALMANVRPTGNRSTEVALASAFRRAGITGWRRHVKVRCDALRSVRLAAQAATLKPRYTYPDFVFRRQKIAVYVDGCFWHGCPRHGTRPTNNRLFWRMKIASNMARDSRVNESMRKAGWTVMRIWEHSVKTQPAACARRICRAIAASR
jgi:DNA mismatch endonuclease (patch repair protein)